MKPITYYQSALGMPFAVLGRHIAFWRGRAGKRDIYGAETIKRFERDRFPIVKLGLITGGMPENYKRGLRRALQRAAKA